MTAVFYQADDVTITASAVQGKGGAYDLTSVTGIESGFRAGWLIASITGLIAALVLAATFAKGSVGDDVCYATVILCAGLIWMNISYRPVFVRTTTGLAPLASQQSSDARQKIAAAFVAAKQAATAG